MKKRGLCALLMAVMLAACTADALAEGTESCETHSWSNGVCTVCGYECQHPDSKQTGGTQKNTVIVDNGNGTHTRTFDVYHYYTCTTCGNVEEVFYEQGTETEDHIWKSDNTCAECSAVKPCEHDWSNKDGICASCGAACSHPDSKQTGGTQKNTVIVDNGNGTHTRTFDVYHYYTCTTCGNVEEVFYEQGTETEDHIWKSDNT